jgi:sugar/nucleoside kinase (ribokinase family)
VRMTSEGVFVGLSTIDVVYRVTHFPAANRKIAAKSQDIFVGGPATNAAVAFRLLGGKATVVSAVGRHTMAAIVLDELKQSAIDFIDLNPEFGEIPAISSVAVDGEGQRNVISANATRIHMPPAIIDKRICETTKIVLVDGHAMQACQAWASAACALGKHVVMDGGSWKEGTEELLPSVHTVICSADFMAPGCSSEDDLVKYLLSRGVSDVAITHGAEPVRFFTDLKTGEIPVPMVAAVDTMGAGDIFHGAYCYFFSIGYGFEESLERAAEIASESCCYRGTREWAEHLHTESPGPLR